MLHYPSDKNGNSIYNKIEVQCHNCGTTIQPGNGQRVELRDYDWDSDDPDEQGSVLKTLDSWYEHIDSIAECARAAIRTGHNIRYLREIASGRERITDVNPTIGAEIRQAAQNALSEIGQVHRDMAHGDDLAARESGYGVIGGPRR